MPQSTTKPSAHLYPEGGPGRHLKARLKNGDVLQTVNGYTLSSPDKILEVYGKLKDSEQISIDVLRRGKARSFEYTIR